MPTDQPRRRLTGEQRRTSFLDAAATVIGRDGPDAVTMERVAAELGVTKALPYRYFKNRDDLLLELFDRETTIFDGRVREVSADATTLEGRLRAVVECYLDEVASSSLLVTQFEQSRPSADPFEQRRRDRELGTVAFLAGVLRDEHPSLDEQTAVIAASVLAAGSIGLVGLVQKTDWDRARLVDDFIVLVMGSIDALVLAHS